MAGLPHDDIDALVDEFPAGMIESFATIFDDLELDEAPQEGKVDEEEEELDWQTDAFPTLDTMVIWEGEAPSPPIVGLGNKGLQHHPEVVVSNFPPMVLEAKQAHMVEDTTSQRQCRHCAAKETPQWRIGPEGPRTLCNACGISYRNGHLVPEYRPVNSPSFLQGQHSNSHRRIMKMRRLKDSVDAEPPAAAVLGHQSMQATTSLNDMCKLTREEKR